LDSSRFFMSLGILLFITCDLLFDASNVRLNSNQSIFVLLNLELVDICNGSKTSELRHSMPCIEMPEVAYLYGYLLVSARENTPE